ncbi:uncharacterized protein K444DRAFT_608060 [Hyaloscypha bicolor E]|uniref:Uncharacterized protein n=1 Tax=Hyaloscypha bicolor E TaxID=1095630 RepID=A0A2J6TR12_9HELO|nr:uncharacterized protein K444DRAFT_608060 [Hyaloscypha bicolor E]KAH8789750.1 hypothetical protein BGZ57DRAFT_88510 [Hyaloscypha finlandica]PMD65471.1 hypothetical protein K444DRAFT_608060 [Hyaloscypha bicolor E]
MGLENEFQELEQDATGQGGNDGDNNANNANGSNDKTEDTMVDSAIDQFASKEGLPAGLDPEMNNMVNDEINKL